MMKVGTAEAIATRTIDQGGDVKTQSGLKEWVGKAKKVVQVITQLPGCSTMNLCTSGRYKIRHCSERE
jgi:hypothetical protein